MALVVDGLAIFGIVATVAGLAYLRQLARRIPKARMARHTTAVLWGLGITMTLNLLADVILTAVMATGWPGSTAANTWIEISSVAICGSGVMGLVFGIWGIILLFQFGFAFLRAASYDREVQQLGSS